MSKSSLDPQAVSKIRAFAFDVDGVLTDGGIYAVNNDLLRRYDAKDGFALRMAAMNGYKLSIITGGISQTIVQRFVRFGFDEKDIYLRSRNKVEQLQDFCTRHGLTPDQVVYCGDDLPDVGTVRMSGIGACPRDAVSEVIEAADFVSPFPGAGGFVRNLVETIMKMQGKWVLDMDEYKVRF